MILPDKVVTYEQSTISKFTIILNILINKEQTVLELYNKVIKNFDGVDEYIDTLDSLYILGKIDFDDNRKVLIYANRDGM